MNKGTSYLLLQNLKGWSPAQFEHLCAYLHFCPYEHLPLLKFQQGRNPRWLLPLALRGFPPFEVCKKRARYCSLTSGSHFYCQNVRI